MTALVYRFPALILALQALLPMQVAVAHPQNPNDSSPSLEVTLNFIQHKLNDQGIIRYMSYHTDPNYPQGKVWVYTRSVNIASVSASSSSCIIAYHLIESFKLVPNETSPETKLVTTEGDYGIPLKDVEIVKIEPMEQYLIDQNVLVGNTSIITSTQPKTWVLLAQRPHNIYNYLVFQDADLADRVAKALTHAVELCGGGNSDPF
ncbi:MAG: hypothetical protein WBY53_07000 [Acidobacteriaceae bacterium]